MPQARCCICKEEMEFDADATTAGYDPCGLTLTTNVFGPRGQQREQQFYCHIECFRKLVDDDPLMYILEPGYPTVGAQDLRRAQRVVKVTKRIKKQKWKLASIPTTS